jgi:small subunit ribosomal protein S16
MVVIRLSRGGTKKRPFYHLVVADSRRSRDGRYIEKLGFYNPIATGGEVRLFFDKEKIAAWMVKGAQPSDRVASLIKEFEHPEVLEKRKAKNAKLKAVKKAKKEAAVLQEAASSEEAVAKTDSSTAESK